jgi:hypothetical protein
VGAAGTRSERRAQEEEQRAKINCEVESREKVASREEIREEGHKEDREKEGREEGHEADVGEPHDDQNS